MSWAFRRQLLSVGAPLGALATGAISGIARCSTKSTPEHFDFLVVGGGSGGIACARRAATHGKKVMVVERGPDRDENGDRRGGGYGGTCVNVGCVPKKLMYTAATHFEAAETAAGYGVKMPQPKLDWGALVARRNAYVARLNGIYTRNLDNAGITHVEGFARFVAPRHVEVNGVSYTADHVLIAVGGKPVLPDIPGAEHCISSDGFFDLEAQPEKALVVGAGYIAVELAGEFDSPRQRIANARRAESPRPGKNQRPVRCPVCKSARLHCGRLCDCRRRIRPGLIPPDGFNPDPVHVQTQISCKFKPRSRSNCSSAARPF
jgi:glutathione reductase (NADPH)